MLATEAPVYEILLELLQARFPTDELDELFAEGAAMLPENVLDYVRGDSLFAPPYS